ncbi:2TM domain-containing protein [Fibrella arboris]|uniref:2TM domain-containing protein n=1 Tax=Fibrella arboris TaxID=3242486 RepID=UPI0035220185
MIPSETPHDPVLWKQAKERVGFRMHLRSYLIVNGGLWLIYLFTQFSLVQSGHRGYLVPWPIFPMLGWGIGLVSHYASVYRSPNQRNQVEREYEKLKRQQTY